jgi:hypothetical protein
MASERRKCKRAEQCGVGSAKSRDAVYQRGPNAQVTRIGDALLARRDFAHV